jgi:hypothetical protein
VTVVDVAQMTKAEAEKLTSRINRDGYRLGELLLQAHDGRAWAALGYRSWSAYIATEFTFSRATSYRLLAAEREPDALVQGSERLTTETDGPEESSNGELVDALDVDQRPLDTITPDAVLPAPAKKSERVATVPPAVPLSGQSSEGNGPGMPQTRPGVAVPSDQTSGGAELQPSTGPTGELRSPRSAPPGPPKNDTGPVPSLRQEASSTFSALMDATEGIGAKWTPEEATAWENRSKREMDGMAEGERDRSSCAR